MIEFSVANYSGIEIVLTQAQEKEKADLFIQLAKSLARKVPQGTTQILAEQDHKGQGIISLYKGNTREIIAHEKLTKEQRDLVQKILDLTAPVIKAPAVPVAFNTASATSKPPMPATSPVGAASNLAATPVGTAPTASSATTRTPHPIPIANLVIPAATSAVTMTTNISSATDAANAAEEDLRAFLADISDSPRPTIQANNEDFTLREMDILALLAETEIPSNANSQPNALEQENAALKALLAEKDKELEILRLDTNQNPLPALQASPLRGTLIRESDDQDKKRLQELLQEQQTINTELNNQLKMAFAQINELKAQGNLIGKLQAELERLRRELDAAQKEKNAMAADYTSYQGQVRTQETLTQTNIQQLQTKLTDLQTKYQKALTDQNFQDAAIRSTQKKIEELQAQIALLTKQAEEERIRAEAAALEAQRAIVAQAQATAQISPVKQNNNHLEAENARLKAQLTDAEARAKKAESERAEFEELAKKLAEEVSPEALNQLAIESASSSASTDEYAAAVAGTAANVSMAILAEQGAKEVS